MDEEEEWPETWDRNKVYMYTDPTGIKVPVPYGFTVSGADSEKYVTGNVEVKGNLSNLTFTSTGDYPWTQNDDNIWVSGNKGVPDSTSELVSNEFTVGPNGGWVEIEWSVCSQSGYDLLSMIITNTINGTSEKMVKEISGTLYGTAESSLEYTKIGKELTQGKYTVTLKYTKYNNTTHQALDGGYVKQGIYIDYDENGVDTFAIHKQGGLVIYEGDGEINNDNSWENSLSRNQFVWVPVTDINRIYEENSKTKKIKSKLWKYTTTGRTAFTTYQNSIFTDTKSEPGLLYNCDVSASIKYFSNPTYGKTLGYTSDLLYKELETEYNNVIKSIKKYGGFYVGRYETGNLSKNTPVVTRMNLDTSNKTWYELFNKTMSVNTGSSLETGMILGCLWDEILYWLAESGGKTYSEITGEASDWGNFRFNTFTYLDVNGNEKVRDGNKDGMYGGRALPTGCTERNMVMNIYDLAGNMLEWTTEGYSSNRRIFRGGSYASNGYAGTVTERNDGSGIAYSIRK